MIYTFDRYWGAIYSGSIYLYPAYSGNKDKFNNPEYETLVGQGPIPAGDYDVTEIIPDDPHTGLVSIVLQPRLTNKMYGRSGFRCHGDNQSHNHSASDGCIITPHDFRTKVIIGDTFHVI